MCIAKKTIEMRFLNKLHAIYQLPHPAVAKLTISKVYTEYIHDLVRFLAKLSMSTAAIAV